MSYKPEVKTAGGGDWAGNALRFATEAEAHQYVGDLAMRWTAVSDVRVVPSDDDVNYRIVANRLERWSNETRCNRCHVPLAPEGNGTCECGGLIENVGWVK
jgi:hypothetical protein